MCRVLRCASEAEADSRGAAEEVVGAGEAEEESEEAEEAEEAEADGIDRVGSEWLELEFLFKLKREG